MKTMQYSLQQQQQQLSHQQSMILASMRHSPSPSYQGIEYGGQIPMAMGVPVMHGVANPYLVRGKRSDADLSAANRSALLEEFRGNKSRKWELRVSQFLATVLSQADSQRQDLFGYIAEFSGDQHGSRFIQQKLESATTEEVSTIFDEIIPKNALQLIKDVFGNYVGPFPCVHVMSLISVYRLFKNCLNMVLQPNELFLLIRWLDTFLNFLSRCTVAE